MKKKFTIVGLATGLFLYGVTGLANATSITQNFTNSWSVDVWDYDGYIAAIEWEYHPYSTSTGSLESVELSYKIVVSEMEVGDDFRYRTSFFTGWEPAEYQFYIDEWFYDVTNSNLNINLDLFFTSSIDLDRWTNPLYGPDGHYYFESTTFNNSHTVNVTTQLTYNYTPTPEPTTMLLLGTGLVGVAGAARRRKKNQER